MTTTEITEPVSPVIGPCPAWCEPDCHDRLDQPADRVHFGADHRFPGTLLDLVTDRQEDGTPAFELDTVRVYLRRHDRETEATVDVGIGEKPGFLLTLGEAEHLSRTLTAVVAEARAARRP